MKYRPEIDGLRAIAVLPVILFHAGFPLFSGGFIGVDVFFVISGYLITSILIDDIENNKFSLINFYERRARRILPALFFVIFVCIPFAWLWMPQAQIIDFSQSLIAVSFFISNFLFWRESGYFDTIVDEKPLLHTWSLAVEEQFYIFFPILLILLWSFSRNKTFWFISMLALISLIISEWGSRNEEVANFYLAPSRVWELFTGSIAAFILSKKRNLNNNFLSTLGLLAIAFSIFYFDKNTPFPSLYTLTPVIGTFLMIIYGHHETFVAKFLSNKVFVSIGLISYSAYLWHQPLFAFTRIKLIQEPSNLIVITLIIFNFVLAYLSWKFVEKPFRSKNNKFNRKEIFSYSILAIVLTTIIGFVGSSTNLYQKITISSYENNEGLVLKKILKATKRHLSLEMSSTDCHIWIKNTSSIDQNHFSKCNEKHGNALIILGDSHAMNFFNIVSYSGSYPFIIAVAQGGCRPYRNFNSEKCQYLNFENFIQQYKNSINLIVFHQSGSYFIADKKGIVDSDFAFKGGFSGFDQKGIKFVKEYLEHFVKDYNVPTIWVGPFLEYRRKPEDFLLSDENYRVNRNSINLFKALDSFIMEIVNNSIFTKYIPFENLFWQPQEAIFEDCFVFRNKDHYSQCGEKLIGLKSYGIKYFEGAILKKKMPSIYLNIDKHYHP